MLTLPPAILAILATFAPVFSRPVWRPVLVLLVGTILTPGQRHPQAGTRTSVLRVMGLDHLSSVQTDHRVLNRALGSLRLPHPGVPSKWGDPASSAHACRAWRRGLLIRHPHGPRSRWHAGTASGNGRSRSPRLLRCGTIPVCRPSPPLGADP